MSLHEEIDEYKENILSFTNFYKKLMTLRDTKPSYLPQDLRLKEFKSEEEANEALYKYAKRVYGIEI